MSIPPSCIWKFPVDIKTFKINMVIDTISPIGHLRQRHQLYSAALTLIAHFSLWTVHNNHVLFNVWVFGHHFTSRSWTSVVGLLMMQRIVVEILSYVIDCHSLSATCTRYTKLNRSFCRLSFINVCTYRSSVRNGWHTHTHRCKTLLVTYISTQDCYEPQGLSQHVDVRLAICMRSTHMTMNVAS